MSNVQQWTDIQLGRFVKRSLDGGHHESVEALYDTCRAGVSRGVRDGEIRYWEACKKLADDEEELARQLRNIANKQGAAYMECCKQLRKVQAQQVEL